MKKTNLIILSAALITLSCIMDASAADKPLPTAFIGSLSGKVQIWLQGDDDWSDAKIGLVLEEGDKIKTGADSEAVLQWANGHKLKVYALSVVNIDQLSSRGTTEKTGLSIEEGKIFAKANKLKSDNSSFSVATPTAVAGVRGTQFLIDVTEGESTIALLEGSLDIVSDSVEMILEENMQVMFDADMETAPQAEGLDPSLRNEMESESKSLGSVTPAGSSSAAPATTTPAPASSDADTQSLIEATIDEVIQSQKEDIEPVVEEEAPVPPMPPDR